MKKYSLLLLFFTLLPWAGEAQCSMCRAVLESEADQGAAEGINQGIIYLMAIPYILMAAVAYFVYRSFKK